MTTWLCRCQSSSEGALEGEEQLFYQNIFWMDYWSWRSTLSYKYLHRLISDSKKIRISTYTRENMSLFRDKTGMGRIICTLLYYSRKKGTTLLVREVAVTLPTQISSTAVFLLTELIAERGFMYLFDCLGH